MYTFVMCLCFVLMCAKKPCGNTCDGLLDEEEEEEELSESETDTKKKVKNDSSATKKS